VSFGRIISRAMVSAAALALSTGIASAGVLFQNPDPISSTPGNVDAWNITFGFAVSDTFTLSSNSSLSSVDFLVWNQPGDKITAVDWTISSTSDLNVGTIFGSASGASVSDVSQGTNSVGFDLNLDTFSLGGLNLNVGTYWLTIQNAVVTSPQDTAFWDQGGGTSQAFQSGTGDLVPVEGQCAGIPNALPTNGSCAETFRINGTNGAVPEPFTLSIFGAGLLGAAAMRRRKAKSA